MKLSNRAARWRLLTTAVASVLAFVLVGTAPASAHYVYEEGEVYRSNDLCTKMRSEISHGDGGGYSRVDTNSHTILATPWGSYPCAKTHDRPINYIASRMDIMAWNGSAWYVCAYTDYAYNQASTWSFIINAWMPGQPWCGTGWYGTMGTGYVWNNAWFGGSLWSGSHWLPDYSKTAMKAPTTRPKPGDTVGVLDKTGKPVLRADGKPVRVVLAEPPSKAPAAIGTTTTKYKVAEDGAVTAIVPTRPATDLVSR